MLTAIKLPQSFGVALALCKLSTQACLSDIAIEDKRSTVRVGPFAVDQSYWQFYVGFEGVNVSFRYRREAAPGRSTCSPSPRGCGGGVDCADYALVVMPRYLWWRVGALAVDGAAGTLSLTRSAPRPRPPSARARRRWRCRPFKLPAPFNTSAHFALSLGNGAVGLREGAAAPTVAELVGGGGGARKAEEVQVRQVRRSAPVKEAVQAATLWNYIYCPPSTGRCSPSRARGTLCAAPDDRLVVRHLRLGQHLRVVHDVARRRRQADRVLQLHPSDPIADGARLRPKHSAGGSKSVDRTRAAVGATVLLELHTRFNDTWLAEFLFDDLLAWSDWFVAEREFGPLGLVSLGSDNVALGYTEFSAGQMQGARYESGLDNSPMYDGEFFKVVKAEGSLTIGQMAMYDVGFASMVVREADALATLATRLGRADDATRLAARAAAQREAHR